MHSKILIIGNGFDLYHKLPTGYKDFLFFAKHWKLFKDEYDKQSKMVECHTKKLIEIQLGEHNELTLQSLKDFSKHAYLYCKQHIDYLDEHLENNAWLTYFNTVTLNGQNWIDFETEIYRVLTQVDTYFRNNASGRLNTLRDINSTNSMNDVFDIFISETEADDFGLDSCEAEIHDSKELWFGKVYNKPMLLDIMKKELDSLNLCLNYYLQEFVSALNFGVYSEQIKELNDIYLLNFNYTYTYAMVYGKARMLKHHPVHGELKEENLVLGIPDDSFNDSMDYVYFQKYFQRITKKTGNFYMDWAIKPKFPTLSDEPVHVFIMGHSLNKVDKGVLETFFLGDYVEKIKIFYHNQDAYEKQVINLIEMFGKEFVIKQTGMGRIVFEKLGSAVVRGNNGM